jgi:hypothetical protein
VCFDMFWIDEYLSCHFYSVLNLPTSLSHRNLSYCFVRTSAENSAIGRFVGRSDCFLAS